MLNYASVLNGFTGIAITRLDILSGLDTVKVAYAYECDGRVIDTFPASLTELARCKPIYKEFPGWPEIDPKTSSFSELHPHVQDYLNFISEKMGVEVSIVSLGRGRGDSLTLRNVFGV
jgi:adenylosuccinate synthase